MATNGGLRRLSPSNLAQYSLFILLVVVAAASAGTIVITPTGGSSTATECTQQDPCTFEHGIGAVAKNGDTVVAAPGTFDLSLLDSFQVTKSISIQSTGLPVDTILHFSSQHQSSVGGLAVVDATVSLTGFTLRGFVFNNYNGQYKGTCGTGGLLSVCNATLNVTNAIIPSYSIADTTTPSLTSAAGIYLLNSHLIMANTTLGNVTSTAEVFPVGSSLLSSTNSTLSFTNVHGGYNLLASTWNSTLNQATVQMTASHWALHDSQLPGLCGAPTNPHVATRDGNDDDDTDQNHFGCIRLVASQLEVYNSTAGYFYLDALASSVVTAISTKFTFTAMHSVSSSIYMDHTSITATVLKKRNFWIDAQSVWEVHHTTIDLPWSSTSQTPIIVLYSSSWSIDHSEMSLMSDSPGSCSPLTCASVVYAHASSDVHINYTTLRSTYQWKYMLQIDQSSRMQLANIKFQGVTVAGFLHCVGGQLSIESSNFVNNYIIYDLLRIGNQSNAHIRNSTFNSNRGASVIRASHARIQIDQCTFQNNKGSLALILINATTINATNVLFAGNSDAPCFDMTGSQVQVATSNITSNSGTCGGAFSWASTPPSSFSATDSFITNNQATSGGVLCLRINPGVPCAQGHQFTFTRTYIKDNSAMMGGFIYYNITPSNLQPSFPLSTCIIPFDPLFYKVVKSTAQYGSFQASSAYRILAAPNYEFGPVGANGESDSISVTIVDFFNQTIPQSSCQPYSVCLKLTEATGAIQTPPPAQCATDGTVAFAIRFDEIAQVGNHTVQIGSSAQVCGGGSPPRYVLPEPDTSSVFVIRKATEKDQSTIIIASVCGALGFVVLVVIGIVVWKCYRRGGSAAVFGETDQSDVDGIPIAMPRMKEDDDDEHYLSHTPLLNNRRVKAPN